MQFNQGAGRLLVAEDKELPNGPFFVLAQRAGKGNAIAINATIFPASMSTLTYGQLMQLIREWVARESPAETLNVTRLTFKGGECSPDSQVAIGEHQMFYNAQVNVMKAACTIL